MLKMITVARNITLIILTLSGLFLLAPNYQFQIDIVHAGEEVLLSPVEFSVPAADVYDYVDTRQTLTYGTTTTDPPLGMGVDDTSYTTITEGSYSEDTYTQLEFASFSSSPAGWTLYNFQTTGGEGISDVTATDRQLITKGYNLAAYSGARIVCYTRAATSSYPYEAGDWQLKYYDGSGAHLITNINGEDYIGWNEYDESVSSSYTSFKFGITSTLTADANEQIATDNWYVYGITPVTYYRFEAVFKFTSVNPSLPSHDLYIDFYSALSGSDDLDFYIGTTSNPTNLIAADKQDDFSVGIDDYVGSTMYLKIADNYRSGDTVQTAAYIQRCYIYSPEVAVSWYNNDWVYRKQISIVEQSGAGTDYQIPINVYYNDSTKDIAGSVDCEGLCQTDFDDIRFTASNGTTLLDYWLEYNISTTYAKFWVEVKADISDTAYDVKIFVYFGNSDASSTSSGDATFPVYLDKDNTTGWSATGITVTTSGDYLRFYNPTEATVGYATRFDFTTPADFQYMARYYQTSLGAKDIVNVLLLDASTSHRFSQSMSPNAATSQTKWYYSDGSAKLGGDWTEGTEFVFTMQIDEGDSSTGVDYRRYNTTWSLLDSILGENFALGTPTDCDGIYMGDGSSAGYLDAYFSWIIIRKCIDTEPTFAAPADLEYQDLYTPIIQATAFSPSNPTTDTGITLFAIVTDADVVPMHTVYFEPLAYPTGYNNTGNLYATEVGTNTWSYTLSSLVAGVYCFIAHSADTKHSAAATYTQYQTFYVTQAPDTQLTEYIVIFDSLGTYIPFETFEVYRNGARQYTSTFVAYDYEPQNITIVDRWGETLYSNEFEASTIELVCTVDVYSLKFMSWYDGFCEVNITHGGITYSEIIMPMEVVEFLLYNGSYTYSIDYLNGTTSGDYNIDMTNSTGVVITGDSITDIMSMSEQLWDLVYSVNVTITATNNYVLTIQIDLDNINATINNQLLQVLLNVTNSNSTIYNQTVDLLAQIQNTNTTIYNQLAAFIVGVYANQSTIYSQTVTMLSLLSAIDSNITANYLSVYSALNVIDSNLASNFTQVSTTLSTIGSNITANYISVAAMLNALDSNLLANFTSISATLSLIDSSLLSNFTSIVSTLTAIGSNITTNYLSLLSQIINVNSTIYSQTVLILTYALNTNQAVNLVLDPSTFNIIFADVTYSDDFAHFYVMSNHHNGTVTIYEDGVLSSSPVSETTVPILYPLSTTAGTHNLSLKIVSGSNVRWYNTSYTVAAILYGWCYVSPYFPSGVGYDLNSFQLWINGTRHYTRDWKFRGRIDLSYEIVVKDYFGTVLYNTTYAFDYAIDILIPVYEFSVSHMLWSSYVSFVLTSPSGATWSSIIHPPDVVRFYLHANQTYSYSYAGIFNASSDAIADYKTYTGSVYVDSDRGLVIVSWGLEKVLEWSRTYQGGGGMTPAELQAALNTFADDRISPIQNALIVVALITIVIVIILILMPKGTTTVIRTTGTQSSSIPVPTQLQGHTFKGGKDNPQNKRQKQ